MTSSARSLVLSDPRLAARLSGAVLVLLTGLILLAALAALAPPASAEVCSDYRHQPRWISTVDTPGEATGIVLLGDVAYVADGVSGLQVIDVSDLEAPAIVGAVPIPGCGQAMEVAMHGDRVYVMTKTNAGAGCLFVLDATPMIPVITGSISLPSNPWDLAATDDHVFVAAEHTGIVSIDVSNPAAPAIDGILDTPEIAGSVTTGPGPNHICVGTPEALLVLEITNPASPAVVGRLARPAGKAVIAGNLAYILLGSPGGLGVVDLTTPTAPVVLGQALGSFTYGSLAVDGHRAHVAADELITFDISDPSAPTRMGGAAGLPLVLEYSVASARGHAFVAVHSAGVQIIDVQNLESTTPVGAADLMFAGRMAATNDLACVVSGLPFPDISLVDFSNPAVPVVRAGVTTPGSAAGVAIQEPSLRGNAYAFVADGNAGLQVVDILPATAPAIVASLDTPGSASDVVLGAEHAYVCDGAAGLAVVDITDPLAPSLAGSIDTPGSCARIALATPDLACVADAGSGFHTIDVTDPDEPAILGSLTSFASISIAARSDLAVAGTTTGGPGLRIIDIKKRDQPIVLASLALPDLPLEITIDGDLAYVAANWSGIVVVDLVRPSAPRVLGVINTTWGATSVRKAGDVLLVGDWEYGGGVLVLEPQCRLVTAAPEPASAGAPAASLVLRSVWPNPSHGAVEIAFATRDAGRLELAAYDVAGRHVRTLMARAADRGEHEIAWDGRDDRGGHLPSGVYFLRLRGPGGETIRPVTLVR
jgi:hypothetical protein